MKSLYTLIILLIIYSSATGQAEFRDSTFNNNGIITYSSSTSISNLPNSTIIIQNDNKILHSTSSYYMGTSKLRRVHPNGIVDSTFSNDGVVSGSLSNFDDIALQSDNKIIWVQNNDSTFTLQRLHQNGDLDSTFGNNGLVSFPIQTTQAIAVTITCIKNIIIQNDDKILVGGIADYYSLLMRFNVNGTIDSTFGTNGQMDINSGQFQELIHNFEIQANGKIIITGEFGGDIFTARLDTSGHLDATFGTNGITIVPYSNYERARKIKFQSDGSIIIAAWSFDYTPMNEQLYNLIIRLTENGQFDASFGNNGFTIIPSIFNGEGTNDNLLIQPDDKIILCGDGCKMFRFHSNGNRDYNFGINGEIALPFNYIESVQLQSDNKFIVSGHGGHNTNNPVNFIIRLNPSALLLNNDIISVDTSQIDFNLNIFPNPLETEGFITYELTKQSNINIYILNGMGQIVQVIKQNETKDAGKYTEPLILKELPRRSINYLWLDDGTNHIARPFLLKEK